MLPFYKKNKANALFFVIFLLINTVLLVNMTIGIFYLNYKSLLIESASQIKDDHEVHELLDKIISQEHVDKTELFQALEDYISDHPNPRQANTIALSSFVEVSSGSKIAKILSSDKFNFIMGMFSGICFLLLVFEEDENSMSKSSPWIIFAAILNSLLLFENLLRLRYHGVKFCLKNYLFVFDFIGDIMAEVFILAFLISDDHAFLYWLNLFLVTKFAKFYNALFLVKSLNFTYLSFLKLMPFTFEMFSILLISFWFFAQIGIYMFGGALNSTVNLEQWGLPQSYVYNNFNDILNAYTILFELLMINNWMVQVEVHVKVMGSKNYRIFFVIFYFWCCLLCINVIVGFVIDYLVSQYKFQEITKKIEEQQEEQDFDLNLTRMNTFNRQHL